MIEVVSKLAAPLLLGDTFVFPEQIVEVDEHDSDVVTLLASGDFQPASKAQSEATLLKRAKKLSVKRASQLSRNRLAEEVAHAEGEAAAQEEHGIDFGEEAL